MNKTEKNYFFVICQKKTSLITNFRIVKKFFLVGQHWRVHIKKSIVESHRCVRSYFSNYALRSLFVLLRWSLKWKASRFIIIPIKASNVLRSSYHIFPEHVKKILRIFHFQTIPFSKEPVCSKLIFVKKCISHKAAENLWMEISDLNITQISKLKKKLKILCYNSGISTLGWMISVWCYKRN